MQIEKIKFYVHVLLPLFLDKEQKCFGRYGFSYADLKKKTECSCIIAESFISAESNIHLDIWWRAINSAAVK